MLRIDERTGVAFGTDGVGTKMLVAERMGDFTTIGIDCIAMNVNDLICVGAEPIAMLDFILCGEADPEVCGAIGVGLRTGAERAGIEIPGGEIAQVGEIVSGIELTGSAIGLVALDVDRRRRPPSSRATRSSGCLRRACTRTATRSRAGRCATCRSTDDRLGRPLGEILLEPTEIYVPAILELLESGVGVRGLAHITGDGLNNLTRLAAPVGYEISDPLEVPPVFELIAELGEVPEDEMYEVFNMGCGFVCVVAAADEEAALRLAPRPLPEREADRHGHRPRRGRRAGLGGRRERPPVGGGRGRGRAAEVLAQRGGGAEAGAAGDLLDREVGVLEQAAGLEHALRVQPLQRRGPGLGHEPAGEGARADRRARRQRGDVERLGQVVERPGADRLERAVVVARRQGPLDELRLAAVAVRGRDHRPRDRGADPLAVVGADRGAGRGRSRPRARPT